MLTVMLTRGGMSLSNSVVAAFAASAGWEPPTAAITEERVVMLAQRDQRFGRPAQLAGEVLNAERVHGRSRIRSRRCRSPTTISSMATTPAAARCALSGLRGSGRDRVLFSQSLGPVVTLPTGPTCLANQAPWRGRVRSHASSASTSAACVSCRTARPV
jgi:hypothetical protein